MRQSTSEELAPSKLSSRVISTGNISWKTMQFIQDDSFKELSAESKKRLKNSLMQNEFTQPFYVWTEEKTLTHYCLDGRHRVIALTELESEGHDIPEYLPATFIKCIDKKEAARLVLVYSSMYAKVSEQGLFDFIQEYELQSASFFETVDLPSIDLSKIMGEVDRDFNSQNQELVIEEFSDEIILKLKYSKPDYLEIKQKMNTLIEEGRFVSYEGLFKSIILSTNA